MASPSYDHPRRVRRRFRRISRPASAGVVLLALAITAVPASAAEGGGIDGSVMAPAGIAIAGLTSGDPGFAAAKSIPHDFETRFGYRPVLRQGLLVAPNGDCSSPVELPPEFDTACMAHDLGYDLLRYAARTGAPLGPWARQSLDHTLGLRLHQACDAHDEPMVRTRCETFAGIAAAAVDLNSRRQHYGVPVVETFTQAATQAATEHPTQPWLLRAFALAAATIAAVVLGIRRLHRRVRSTVGPVRTVVPVLHGAGEAGAGGSSAVREHSCITTDLLGSPVRSAAAGIVPVLPVELDMFEVDSDAAPGGQPCLAAADLLDVPVDSGAGELSPEMAITVWETGLSARTRSREEQPALALRA